jgi:hypothetical protein
MTSNNTALNKTKRDDTLSEINNQFITLKENNKIVFTNENSESTPLVDLENESSYDKNLLGNLNPVSTPLVDMENNSQPYNDRISDNNNLVLLTQSDIECPLSTILSPHVFVFIDDSVKLTKKTRLEKRLNQIRLGDRKYNARKVYHDNNSTAFDLLRSIIGFNLDLGLFMKKFRISQISGFVVHPLTKMGDLVLRENHLILNRRRNGNPGFDESLRRKTRVFGLDNLGNTCFMNSALQCILACREFTDHLLLIKHFLILIVCL